MPTLEKKADSLKAVKQKYQAVVYFCLHIIMRIKHTLTKVKLAVAVIALGVLFHFTFLVNSDNKAKHNNFWN